MSNRWMDDIEQQAKGRLSHEIYDFVAGGADNEHVLQNNAKDFNHISLIPRVLQNVATVNTEIMLNGQHLSSPILIAPMAPHKLLHAGGELETARASRRMKTVLVVSCMSSVSLENIAVINDENLWFQIHIFRDRDITQKLVEKAESLRYQALVVTVDM